MRVIQRLGIGEVLDGFAPVERVAVFGPSGIRADAAIPDIEGRPTTGYVIPRREFDNRLFQQALKAGADDFSGMRFVDMELGAAERPIRLRGGDGRRRTVNARLVVGADEAYSAVRRSLILRKDARRSKHTGLAMRAYAKLLAPWPSATPGPCLLLDFSRELLPSYGWAFPIGDDLLNIGVGGPLDVLRQRGADLRQLLEAYAESMRARVVSFGELSDRRACHLPHVAGMPLLAHPRAALIGDAASMINPVSGEGIAYAVTAAAQLIDALPERLDDYHALAAAPSRFEHDFRSRYRTHFASSRVVLRLLRSPVWSSVLVRSMQRDPRVFSDAVDMLFGFGRFHLSTALRVLNPRLR